MRAYGTSWAGPSRMESCYQTRLSQQSSSYLTPSKIMWGRQPPSDPPWDELMLG